MKEVYGILSVYHLECLDDSFIAFLMRFDKSMFFFVEILEREESRLRNLIAGLKRFLRAEITVSRLSFLKKISSMRFIEWRIEWQAPNWRPIAYKARHAACVYARVTAELLIGIPTYGCRMYQRLWILSFSEHPVLPRAKEILW